MDASLLSLAGLVLSIFIGIVAKVNIGLIAIGMAFILSFFIGFDAQTIVASWPTGLFLMLFGMSLLFGIATTNGTLKKLIEKCTLALKGRIRVLPLLFFIVSTVIAAMGPGNIAVVAMMMPLALALAREEKISMLLVASMVILGANAGGLSPIAATGIIANNLAKHEGLHITGTLFRDMFIVSGSLGIVTYIALSGYKIPHKVVLSKDIVEPFTKRQKITILVILLAVTAIIFGGNIALTAFLASGCLLLFRVSTEKEALRQVPWSALLLVSGVALMTNIVQKAQGMTILTHMLGNLTNQQTVGPMMAFLGGTMSLVSSAAGVVLPTLIPTVKGVAAEAGGTVKPEALISAIAIGSHLVSVFPFSTLGAFAIASAGDGKDKDVLFRKLILAGLLFLFIGAFISYFIMFLY